MVTNIKRPDNRANYSNNPRIKERTLRPLGGAAAHDIRSPLSPVEKIARGAHQAIMDRLVEVAQEFAGEKPTRAEHVTRALLRQTERLASDEKEDWTTTQLTEEYIARAVLMSPFASNAQLHRNENPKRNKRRLAGFNDALTDCATCIQPRVARELVPMLKGQITQFSQFAGVQPAILANNNLENMMKGLAPEVGVRRALIADGTYEVEAPGVEEDMRGIDLTIKRDERTVHFDLGMEGAFKRKVQDGLRYGSIHPDDATGSQEYGYVYAGNDKESGYPKYIVDASQFGVIDGFDYCPEDQARVIGRVNEIITYHYDEA